MAFRACAVRFSSKLSNESLIAATLHELPKEPSWSVSTLIDHHSSSSASSTSTITPETVDKLLSLARLNKPEDLKSIKTLYKDLERMGMFLNHIQDPETNQQLGIDRNSPTLRSLVDDGRGSGWQLRHEKDSNQREVSLNEKDGSQSMDRQELLSRSVSVKGNYFAVRTKIDPAAGPS